MNIYLVTWFKPLNLKTALELLILLSLLVVWFVWPLRGTIAARNIALVMGAIASFAWLIFERPKFSRQDFLPIGLLMCVPAWLLGLFFFNPVVPELQWNDLKGTWLRVVIGVIFAIGLGKIYLNRPKYQKFFFWILFIWPLVILFLFITQWVTTFSWFEWTVFIYVFKSKIAGVYFLIWSLLLCLALAHWYLSKQSYLKQAFLTIKLDLKTMLMILFFICLIDLFSLRSLNGFIALLAGFVFLAYLLIVKKKKSTTGWLYFIRASLILTGVLIFIIAVLAYDIKYSGGKLVNLAVDIDFIINDDNTEAWKWDGSYKGMYPPINTISGHTVNGSTYERLTWFIEGLKFLKNNPFGLGYTGQAFSYYMSQTYPGSVATKTHSGWLDFALGTGFIGLISVWTAMGMIFWRAKTSLKKSTSICQMHLYICWALAILMILWFIAELSDREYIEHFFITLIFFSITSGTQK